MTTDTRLKRAKRKAFLILAICIVSSIGYLLGHFSDSSITKSLGDLFPIVGGIALLLVLINILWGEKTK